MKRVFLICGIIIASLIASLAITTIVGLRQSEKRISYFQNIKDVEDIGTKSYYTFMTYNIQMGFKKYDNPWDKKEIGGTKKNLMKIVEAIRLVNPDIVALQEVAEGRSNIKIKNQIKFLAEKLKMNYAYGDHGKCDVWGIMPRGRWGNAILSKYKIINIKNHEIFYKNRYKRRSCLEANIQLPQGVITVFSTHFEFEKTKEHVKNIVNLIQRSTNPVVLMGDFNLLPEEKYMIPILKELSDTCKEVNNENSLFVQQYGTIGEPPEDIIKCPWCGKPLPVGQRIDNIFISQEFKVVDVGLIPKKYWEVSDHKGYFAKARFKDNEKGKEAQKSLLNQ